MSNKKKEKVVKSGMSRKQIPSDPDMAWSMLQPHQPIIPPKRQIRGVSSSIKYQRVVCVSDTHGRHRGMALPRGDILIHCGDFTDTGQAKQVRDFTKWLLEAKQTLRYSHVVVIAGNHDITFDEPYYEERGAAHFHKHVPKETGPGIIKTKQILTTLTLDDNNSATENISNNVVDGEVGGEAVMLSGNGTIGTNGIIYLEDGLVQLRHHSEHSTQPCFTQVYGSPYQPEFCDWAFNLPRGEPCRLKWEEIPACVATETNSSVGDEAASEQHLSSDELGSVLRSESSSASAESTVEVKQSVKKETPSTQPSSSSSSSTTSSSSVSPQNIDAKNRSVDLLLTHGPPLGRGDILHPSGNRSGCVDLLSRVQKFVKPLLHVFGHIHEGAGEVSSDGEIMYANASTCNFHYQSINPALVFDLIFKPQDDAIDQESSSPLRPHEVVLVDSEVIEWSVEEVQSWLGSLVQEEENQNEGGGGGSGANDTLDNQSKRRNVFPQKAITTLQGMDGASLLKLDPTDDRLMDLSRNQKVEVIRAIRHVEASLFVV